MGELAALFRLDGENPAREQAELSRSDAIRKAAEPFLALAEAAGTRCRAESGPASYRTKRVPPPVQHREISAF